MATAFNQLGTTANVLTDSDLSGVATAAGSPGAHYQSKGGDIYIKSEVIDDIQHYKRLSIAYSSRLGTWGFNDPEGDYVLFANGDFVPAT